MSDRHSNSECKNILSGEEINKNLFKDSEHFEQLDKIVKAKGKLVVYLSIIYGAIIALALLYLFIT